MPDDPPFPPHPLLAFCPVCGAAFLQSEDRPWSPCHAGDPLIMYDIELLLLVVERLAERVLGPLSSADDAPAALGAGPDGVASSPPAATAGADGAQVPPPTPPLAPARARNKPAAAAAAATPPQEAPA